MQAYPFPDRIGSREELKRDLLYKRIPAKDRTKICDAAWFKGAAAAQAICEKYGTELAIRDIIAQSGLTIESKLKDNVVAGVRYFSEYFSGKKKIYVYKVSIEKWAKANGIPYGEAENLILAHEFYHHLECTQLGLTSKDYQVDNIKIGKFVLTHSGIRALSEIGANGFARSFFEIRGELPESSQQDVKLRNRAMNLMDFEGKRKANRIDAKLFGRLLMEEVRGER